LGSSIRACAVPARRAEASNAIFNRVMIFSSMTGLNDHFRKANMSGQIQRV
jgi:hypothetical protein